MIPHIEDGEACIIVAINKEARAKAAKIMGTVSLGNKAIKGVAKVREAMQEAADNRGEPPNSQDKMERRHNNKYTREKTAKRANARELRTESIIAKIENRQARNLPKSATPRGVKEKALFLKKSGGDTLEARKMEMAKFETRNASANNAKANKSVAAQEAAKRSNKGKMSKSDFGMSPQAAAPNAIAKMKRSFPRRGIFAASGGFARVEEKRFGRR